MIGTAILKVCERPDGVTDRSDGLGKAPESQIWTYVDLHCNPGSPRENRMCRRPVYWIREGPRRSDIDLIRLELQSWKSVRGQYVSQTDVLDLGGSREVSYGLCRLAPEPSKSSRGQRVSQTGAMNWVEPQKIKSGLMSTVNAILEFYEGPERVTDRCIRLGRAPGGEIWT